jgi:hypothetical protein
MIKNEPKEILDVNELGQWSLNKSYINDNSKFHIHRFDIVRGKGPRLTTVPKTRQELMSDPIYARLDGKPHESWSDFIDHHRKTGYIPVKV